MRVAAHVLGDRRKEAEEVPPVLPDERDKMSSWGAGRGHITSMNSSCYSVSKYPTYFSESLKNGFPTGCVIPRPSVGAFAQLREASLRYSV